MTEPITAANFVAWAEARVKAQPTYNAVVWERGTYHTEARPNTVEHELGHVLLNCLMSGYAHYEQSEFMDAVRDMLWDGVPGISTLDRTKLLADLMEVVVAVAAADNHNLTWEGLVQGSELFAPLSDPAATIAVTATAPETAQTTTTEVVLSREDIIKVARKAGVLIHHPDASFVDEETSTPAHHYRKFIASLGGKSGHFRTVHGIDEYDVLELAGVSDEHPDFAKLAGALDPDGTAVFEAPPDYPGETCTTLLFYEDRLIPNQLGQTIDFRSGQNVRVCIPALTDRVTGRIYPAEEFSATVHRPQARCLVSRLDGMEVRTSDGTIVHIDPAWAELVPQPC